MDLLDVRVDEGLEAVALALNDKLALASLELGAGQEDELDEGEDAVALDLLGGGDGLADLLEDRVGVVEEVDFGVWLVRFGSKNTRKGMVGDLLSSLELILLPCRPGTMALRR